MKRGIDVSSYQGRIDWTRVKPYIDFAIIRCGWGNNVSSQDDVFFERNAQECANLNIPYGVYLFSYATTIDEARSEVEHTLRLIKGKKLLYPVFLDVEARRQMALKKDELLEIVKYYCEEMERNGYYVGIYASLNSFRGILNSAELNRFDKWVAEWNSQFTYTGQAGMWQNTSYEEIPGIRTRVDGDIAFLDYPRIIRENNLNHLGEDNLRFRRGDRVYLTGDIYKDSAATEVVRSVCDEEVEILSVLFGEKAPYEISEGYVKEADVYTKSE